MHFERRMPFKIHKIIFFPEKKNIKKMCVPTQPKISDPLSETHLFFYLALMFFLKFGINLFKSDIYHKLSMN